MAGERRNLGTIQNRQTYKRVLRERRFMGVATFACAFCLCLFIVAAGTNSWVIAEVRRVVTPDATLKPADQERFNITITLHIGIWQEHKSTRFDNGTVRTEWIPHFPAPPKHIDRLDDVVLPHYYRVQAVFSVIATLLMIAGILCAIYSLNQHRYMYKRLTAGIYSFAAMCILVVIEVMLHHMNLWWKGESLEKHPEYGYSTAISWFCFAVYIVAAVIFIIGSRKHKGSRAATEEFDYEDRPIELGR